jgi:hypothetical protein
MMVKMWVVILCSLGYQFFERTYPEDEGDMFFQNVSNLLQDYMAS